MADEQGTPVPQAGTCLACKQRPVPSQCTCIQWMCEHMLPPRTCSAGLVSGRACCWDMVLRIVRAGSGRAEVVCRRPGMVLLEGGWPEPRRGWPSPRRPPLCSGPLRLTPRGCASLATVLPHGGLVWGRTAGRLELQQITQKHAYDLPWALAEQLGACNVH
jgi:hypothetical protein